MVLVRLVNQVLV